MVVFADADLDVVVIAFLDTWTQICPHQHERCVGRREDVVRMLDAAALHSAKLRRERQAGGRVHQRRLGRHLLGARLDRGVQPVQRESLLRRGPGRRACRGLAGVLPGMGWQRRGGRSTEAEHQERDGKQHEAPPHVGE